MVIYPDSFSIKPDSEVTVAFCNLLNTASENANPKSLLLEKGNYVFLSKYANERELYITNTIADKEYSETDKKHIHKIALDLKGINDLEIDFNNSTFIFDGIMTNIVIENCVNVTLKNLNIETVQPNVHKITIMQTSPFYVTFKIDESSNYKEEDGEYFWYGTDYKLGFTELKNSGSWTPTAKASNYNHVKRNGSHPFFGVSTIKEVSPRVFKARYLIPKDFEVGQVFYVFPKARKNVGVLVDGSKNIKLENITQRFNYSLGLVAQNSEDITLENSDFSPREAAEVDFSSLADFVVCSMCRGKVKIKNCKGEIAKLLAKAENTFIESEKSEIQKQILEENTITISEGGNSCGFVSFKIFFCFSKFSFASSNALASFVYSQYAAAKIPTIAPIAKMYGAAAANAPIIDFPMATIDPPKVAVAFPAAVVAVFAAPAASPHLIIDL